MSPEELDHMRRSLAIGGSLTGADAEQLLNACASLLAERAAIARILDELGPSWTRARRALNELSKIVGAG
jgi:hypothetical protein